MHLVICRILVSRPGIKPEPHALEVQSLNHWPTSGKSFRAPHFRKDCFHPKVLLFSLVTLSFLRGVWRRAGFLCWNANYAQKWWCPPPPRFHPWFLLSNLLAWQTLECQWGWEMASWGRHPQEDSHGSLSGSNRHLYYSEFKWRSQKTKLIKIY